MRIESSGHSRGNPRLFELVEGAPKTGKSPTVWAWPELMDYLKIAGQPVPGPWPPHQEPRPDPEEDSLPVAVAEPPDEADPPRGMAPEARLPEVGPTEVAPTEVAPTTVEPTTVEPTTGTGPAGQAGPPPQRGDAG